MQWVRNYVFCISSIAIWINLWVCCVPRTSLTFYLMLRILVNIARIRITGRLTWITSKKFVLVWVREMVSCTFNFFPHTFLFCFFCCSSHCVSWNIGISETCIFTLFTLFQAMSWVFFFFFLSRSCIDPLVSLFLSVSLKSAQLGMFTSSTRIPH